MPLPALLLGAAKGYLADKALNAIDAPQGVREAVSFATDPKGYLRSLAVDAVKSAVSAPAETSRSISEDTEDFGFRKGGNVKSKSASSRADGCCKRGKTRGKMY